MRPLLLSLGMIATLLLPPQPSMAAGLEVRDDDGTLLVMTEPARRIISLAPSMTELLYSLGAGEQIVGVMAFSDFPAPAQQLPVVGRHDMLDMERILDLQPDLIVAWRSGNPRGALSRLRELGFPVYIAEPVSLFSVSTHLQRLGVLTGHAQQGQALATQFNTEIETLQQRYSERAPVRVFYQVWHAPMISVGGAELINDMIRLCGGQNIFAELPIGPKVNLEDVLARNPQVIIASGSTPEAPTWLEDWQRWPQLEAVASANLYAIPPDLVQRHSLRAAQGAQQMCEHIDQARTLSPAD